MRGGVLWILDSEACPPVACKKRKTPALLREPASSYALTVVRVRRGLVTRGVLRIRSHQLAASTARSGAVRANRTAVRRSGAGRGSRSAAAGSSTAALGLVTAVTVLLEPAEQAAVLAGTAAARRSTALSRSRSAAGRSGRSSTSRSTGRGGAGRANRTAVRRSGAGRVASSRSSAGRVARSGAARGAAAAAVQLEQASVSAVHASTQNESSKGRPLHLESPRLSRGWNAGTSLVVNRPSLRLRPKSATHYSVGPRPEISDRTPLRSATFWVSRRSLPRRVRSARIVLTLTLVSGSGPPPPRVSFKSSSCRFPF